MCLTTEMLAVFLNILGAAELTTEPDRIAIHAEEGPAVWVAQGDTWCTMAPQLDRVARFEALKPE